MQTIDPSDARIVGETFLGQHIDGEGKVWNVVAVKWSDARTTYARRRPGATVRSFEPMRIDVPYQRGD